MGPRREKPRMEDGGKQLEGERGHKARNEVNKTGVSTRVQRTRPRVSEGASQGEGVELATNPSHQRMIEALGNLF